VLNLTDVDDTLYIQGDASDTVSALGATLSGSSILDGVSYDQYTLGQTTLYVEDDVDVVVT